MQGLQEEKLLREKEKEEEKLLKEKRRVLKEEEKEKRRVLKEEEKEKEKLLREKEKEKEKLLREKEKEEEKLLKEKRRVLKEEEKEKSRVLKEEEKEKLLKEKEKEEEKLLKEKRRKSEIGGVQAALENNIGEVRTECKRLEIELARMKSLEGAVISPTGRNIPPPTFDGQTSLEGFRRQFEAVTLNNGWGETEKVTNLIVALRGPALDLLQAVPRADQQSYAMLMGELELRYGEQHLRQVYQAQLKLRRQKVGEGLQGFEADVKRLCHLAYPGAPIDFLDQLAAQTFIDGIRDVEVQRVLRLASFDKSREALVRALEVEAAYRVSESGHSRVRGAELIAEQSTTGGGGESDAIKEILKKLEQLAWQTIGWALFPLWTIWSSKEAVHRQTARPETTGKLNSANVMGQSLAVVNPPHNIVSILEIKRTYDTLMIEIFVNSIRMKATVDTGAMVSLIKKDVIRSAPTPLRRGMMLKTVTGDSSPILGGLDVEICLGGIRFNHRVLVAEIDDEFILGMDILRRQDFTFDPTQGVLTLGSESFVLSKEGQKDEGVRLFACEDKHIDGNSEGVVRAVAEEPLGCCIGLAEPTDNSAKNLLVARTLVNTIHGKVPIRVANVFFSGVRIRKGDLLATCAPISRISTKEDGQHKIISQTKLELDLKDLSEEEARNARAFLKKNQDVFSSGDGNLGRTDLVRHRINTGDARPIRQPPRRLPMAKQEEVTGLLRKMKRDGIIEESNGPWSSPVVLVTKKDGTTRFCVDYRRLNDITKKDSYPLPRIDDTLTTLAGSSWFSTLDLKSGYWQVGMHPEDKEKTAFSTGSGLYQFTVVPFGLCNAPATFERLIELVLKGLTWKTCLVYLDDIMVMGRTFEEHLRNLQEVFDRFRANNLALNPKKCQLFQKSVKFLGHIVSTEGIRTSDDKIFAIKNWPEPRDKHELRSFLGLCTYYRRFVEGYADIAAPLHRLTEARASFHWNEECEKAFRALKRSLCSSPILAYPQPGTNFILDTDASNLGIGAVLSQVQDGDERVIEFFSRVLTKAERNYCATRKELLAIVKAVEHFHKYLYGQNFLIRTDHAALTWLLRMKNPEGQVARWLEKLQQYHFQIKHRPGRKHNNADALSRRPCGDCKHCERIDEHEVTSRKTTMVPSNDWTAESCRTIQQRDPNIGPILEWKERGNERPSWEVISDKSPELKTLWSQWDSLSIDNGLLKRIWESADGRSKTMQLVVPKVQVPNVLREIHDGVSGAHFGINKTLKKVRERFYWVYYHEDVERWCKECDRCAASKGPKTRSRGVMREYNMGAPFERIAIDVAGPFPVTEGGNKYILVAMDYFTKWPEAYAIPNQGATTVAKVLMDNLICRFGVPLELHSDQGRNFEAGVFQELCRLLGIRKTRTTPLHPQSDGMVERFNKTMEEHLSKVVEQHQRDWDVRLPPFLMAYRAAIHETTGQTPAKIMFGRELRLPCDLEFGSPGEPPAEVTYYVNNLRSILLETHELVRAKIRTASHRMKTRYDQRANHDGFRQNDLVWLFDPKRKKGLSPKLMPVWEGPYKIIKRINDLVYRIQRSSKSKAKVVHMGRLACYQGDRTNWT
ncbi:K02A2.6-like [Cordylochernes scorpioides]|uniref:RNA-directed DNA polymerase n=1 Tax=Cordylochernes scorpioides TaxID=51811 RepID=A0ABY6LTC0_9ARAC|nr:K02A2.6-like [Cordylochernes scorpioides]